MNRRRFGLSVTSGSGAAPPEARPPTDDAANFGEAPPLRSVSLRETELPSSSSPKFPSPGPIPSLSLSGTFILHATSSPSLESNFYQARCLIIIGTEGAGASVYAGLSDFEWGKRIILVLPGFCPLSESLTISLSTEIQRILMNANRDIFDDLAWQFTAYRLSGLCALEFARENGADINIAPWRLIDEGIENNDLTRIVAGNLALLRREQEIIAQPRWDELAGLPAGTGAVVSFLFSILAENPIPNGPDFADVVPGGNITVFDDRWAWVSDSPDPSLAMWTIWTVTPEPVKEQWVLIDLAIRAEDYSLLENFSI